MRCLLPLALLAPVATAQFDPAAPEPIRRVMGEVRLYGEQAADLAEASLELDVMQAVYLLGPDVEVSPFMISKVIQVSREQAGRADLLELIRAAETVLLLGDPAALVETYGGTAIGEALKEALLAGATVAAVGEACLATGALRMDGERLAGGLDLVQGAIVEPAHPGGDRPAGRLAAVLEGLPMFVGIAFTPEGSVRLRERWLLGDKAFAFVRPGAGREWIATALEERRPLADLTSLSRIAQSRATRPWPPGDPAPPRLAKGSLMLGGGPMPEQTIARFLELAGGPDAPLVYIPCAYETTIDSEPGFVASLRGVGAKDVTWIHTKDRSVANGDEQLLAKLRRAKGVWFGGGRQWNLVDSYQHTEAHRLIAAVLERGGVVGGSSAGASIQSDFMARGNPLGNLDIMAEGYEEGLGLITGVAVDQHFSQRGRLPDLQSLVATFPQYLGVGLDEGAVLVVQGQVGEVLGSAVHFLDRSSGEEVHHRIPGGQRFDLVRRAPVEEEDF